MVHLRSLFFKGPISKTEEKCIKAYRKTGVSEVIWNVTRVCNLACQHCYINAVSTASRNELSTSEALKFIGKLGSWVFP